MRRAVSDRHLLVVGGAALLALIVLVLSQYRLHAGWGGGNITIEPADLGRLSP